MAEDFPLSSIPCHLSFILPALRFGGGRRHDGEAGSRILFPPRLSPPRRMLGSVANPRRPWVPAFAGRVNLP